MNCFLQSRVAKGMQSSFSTERRFVCSLCRQCLVSSSLFRNPPDYQKCSKCRKKPLRAVNGLKVVHIDKTFKNY